MQIHIHRDNEDYGPYTPEEVAEHLRQGAFLPEDSAWHDGLTEWTTLGELFVIEEAVPEEAAETPETATESSFPSTESQQPFCKPSAPIWTANLRPPASPVAPILVRLYDEPQPPANRVRVISGPGARETGSGFRIALNLALIAIVIAVACIKFGSSRDLARNYISAIWNRLVNSTPETPVAVATPAPTPAALPAKPLVVAVATPAPVLATPTPPATFNPADLAANPDAWPRTVILKDAAIFPAVFNSQVVGSVSVPKGTTVNLVSINGDQLLLEYRGGRRRLSWNLTDLETEAAKVVVAPKIEPAIAQLPSAPADQPTAANDEPPTDDALPGMGPQNSNYFGREAHH